LSFDVTARFDYLVPTDVANGLGCIGDRVADRVVAARRRSEAAPVLLSTATPLYRHAANGAFD
jgi:hypothetical protein